MSYIRAPYAGQKPQDLQRYVLDELQKIAIASRDDAAVLYYRTSYADAGTLTAAVKADWKLPNANLVRISASATITLTGIALTTGMREIVLVNVGGAAVVLNSEDADSSASHRFAFARTMTLSANDAVILWRDPISARWRALSRT